MASRWLVQLVKSVSIELKPFPNKLGGTNSLSLNQLTSSTRRSSSRMGRLHRHHRHHRLHSGHMGRHHRRMRRPMGFHRFGRPMGHRRSRSSMLEQRMLEQRWRQRPNRRRKGRQPVQYTRLSLKPIFYNGSILSTYERLHCWFELRLSFGFANCKFVFKALDDSKPSDSILIYDLERAIPSSQICWCGFNVQRSKMKTRERKKRKKKKEILS